MRSLKLVFGAVDKSKDSIVAVPRLEIIPLVRVTNPLVRVKPPLVRVTAPLSGSRHPWSGLQTPLSGSRHPWSGLHTPLSGSRHPWSGLQPHACRFRARFGAAQIRTGLYCFVHLTAQSVRYTCSFFYPTDSVPPIPPTHTSNGENFIHQRPTHHI